MPAEVRSISRLHVKISFYPAILQQLVMDDFIEQRKHLLVGSQQGTGQHSVVQIVLLDQPEAHKSHHFIDVNVSLVRTMKKPAHHCFKHLLLHCLHHNIVQPCKKLSYCRRICLDHDKHKMTSLSARITACSARCRQLLQTSCPCNMVSLLVTTVSSAKMAELRCCLGLGADSLPTRNHVLDSAWIPNKKERGTLGGHVCDTTWTMDMSCLCTTRHMLQGHHTTAMWTVTTITVATYLFLLPTCLELKICGVLS